MKPHDWPAFRHQLHQVPELGYEEFKTAALIREKLDALGIEYTAGVPNAPTATIAMIGDPAKPCVALRADIDALPIKEQTGFAYASTHEGRMHACGHDGHITTLLAAAERIKGIITNLPVCVKLLFQPAEEGGGGAVPIITAGALDGRLGPKVRAIFGLHGWPGLKVGTAATKPGALLAATDSFAVTFRGQGVHGAYPHLGRDPIITACEAVVNLQQFVSREVDPVDSAVITIGKFNAGTATNVIPDTATIEGTARTLTDATRRQIQAAMKLRCEGIAAANNCTAKMTWHEGYPSTVNDPAMADYVAGVARSVLGNERFIPVGKPGMGGEDFAFYLEKVPGCFFLLGIQPMEKDGYPPLHSDRFDFTDDAIDFGAQMFVELVRQFRA